MANIKISALTPVTTVVPGTDVAPLVSGGITTKATPQQIVNAGLLAPGAIGSGTPSTGKFTTIESTIATGTAPFTVASTTNVANLNASSLGGATFAAPGAIGSGTASTGAFTTLSASSTVSGTGFSNYLLSPPAIGTTAPAAGKFTDLTSTGNTTIGDASTDTFTVYPQTISLINSTAITAASTKTLTLNGGAGSNGLVIDASNNVLIGTASTVSGGAKLQTVDGITFPATQVASANVNTLDDYEEGTWTPTWTPATGSGQTVNNAAGWYTKIGNAVYVSFILSTNGLGTASGNITIGGLPFQATSISNAQNGAITCSLTANLNLTAGQSIVGQVSFGSTTINPQVWASTTGLSTMTVSQWNTSGFTRWFGLYFV